MIAVRYAVEGPTDEPIAEKLIRHIGCEPFRSFTAVSKSRLDPKIPGYNRSAAHMPWLVLRDLDHDDTGRCMRDVVAGLVGGTLAKRLALRLPVRALESWLLADAEAFTTFFRVPVNRVPSSPDTLDRPKRELVEACRRSRSSDVRAAMVPRPGSGRVVGPGYSELVRDYAEEVWDIQRAAESSPSLQRAVQRLKVMLASGAW